MKAQVGDRLVRHGVPVDEPRHAGVIVEVHHGDGRSPYLVRWLFVGVAGALSSACE
jgi:hypothetical protein